MNALATRRHNMAARRSRILTTAAEMVAGGGVQRLTLRELALAADVTVPTIYNLIGSKEAVVEALVKEALDALDRELESLTSVRGVERALAIVDRSLDLYFADARTYRAVFRGLHELESAHNKSFLGRLFRRAGSLQERAIAEARADGQLMGKLAVLPLAHNTLHAYLGAIRMWAAGTLSRDLTRARARYGLLVGLLADATPKGRRLIQPLLAQCEVLLNR